jgi:hypothetical protein
LSSLGIDGEREKNFRGRICVFLYLWTCGLPADVSAKLYRCASASTALPLKDEDRQGKYISKFVGPTLLVRNRCNTPFLVKRIFDTTNDLALFNTSIHSSQNYSLVEEKSCLHEPRTGRVIN